MDVIFLLLYVVSSEKNEYWEGGDLVRSRNRTCCMHITIGIIDCGVSCWDVGFRQKSSDLGENCIARA